MNNTYDYITPQYVNTFMLEKGILGERARQIGKPSVRKLAALAGCPYNSLALAMRGERDFSEAIKAKLHHYFSQKS